MLGQKCLDLSHRGVGARAPREENPRRNSDRSMTAWNSFVGEDTGRRPLRLVKGTRIAWNPPPACPSLSRCRWMRGGSCNESNRMLRDFTVETRIHRTLMMNDGFIFIFSDDVHMVKQTRKWRLWMIHWTSGIDFFLYDTALHQQLQNNCIVHMLAITLNQHSYDCCCCCCSGFWDPCFTAS